MIRELAAKYRVIAVVGMAKNAGKTTTLNYLIEEADNEGIRLGISSTGRDGETRDVVTGLEKPKVWLYEDTLVATPIERYETAEAGLEILRATGYSSALGEILLCRVTEAGYVEVAGPAIGADQQKLAAEMLGLGGGAGLPGAGAQFAGVDLVIIDGAIDRRAVAAPEATDAIILASGAVLSRNMSVVIAETMYLVSLYRLPAINDEALQKLISESAQEHLIIAKDASVEKAEIATGLMAGARLSALIDDETEYVYLPGALTQGILAEIAPAKLKHITFIVKDATKIFVDSTFWRIFVKKGLKVAVMKEIKIAALSINPTSPEGYAFSGDEFITAMRKAARDLTGGKDELPVIDVIAPSGNR